MIESSVALAATLGSAFMLGLLSSAHCIGMCGGIMGALTLAIPESARGRRRQLVLSYNLGRVLSYTLMGLLAGLLAGALSGWGGGHWLRVLAGLLLIAMGLYLGDWWRGLVWLERGGGHIWRRIQPLGRSLMPVTRAPQALLLGGLWGWLPCGLVYTALAYAMAQGNTLTAGAVMLAFGLGTLPAVLATGLAAEPITRLLRRPGLRRGFALAIVFFGLWTLGSVATHMVHSPGAGGETPEVGHPHH